jgi:hypothetical protein
MAAVILTTPHPSPLPRGEGKGQEGRAVADVAAIDTVATLLPVYQGPMGLQENSRGGIGSFGAELRPKPSDEWSQDRPRVAVGFSGRGFWRRRSHERRMWADGEQRVRMDRVASAWPPTLRISSSMRAVMLRGESYDAMFR